VIVAVVLSLRLSVTINSFLSYLIFGPLDPPDSVDELTGKGESNARWKWTKGQRWTR